MFLFKQFLDGRKQLNKNFIIPPIINSDTPINTSRDTASNIKMCMDWQENGNADISPLHFVKKSTSFYPPIFQRTGLTFHL